MRHKICPICGTITHERAVDCDVCGASLQDVAVVDRYPEARQPRSTSYDFRHGETDLVEGSLRWRGGSYILGGLVVLAVAACGGLVIFSATRFMNMVSPPPVVTPVITVEQAAPLTNTPSPTIRFQTVTADAPPTRTITPSPAPTETPGPCMQEVLSGDSLIALVSRCGHRDLDVIADVLELNNLSAPEVIQVGQTLAIPWPTPTFDPNLLPTATIEGEGEAVAAVAIVTDSSSGEVMYIAPTATLQPGVAWHRVVKDENIIVIAVEYGADIKILSELNPEVSFSQCDFGEFGGGPSCVVNLYEGQQIRVPAPTLTPTLSPTPSGSETPTPSPTATFNAPSAMSPGDRALFRRSDLVTLRWVASGALGEEQAYRVEVQDITTGVNYMADTTELFLIVPADWQGRDNRRHEYVWTVSVIDLDNPDEPFFSTAPRVFVWEGLAEDADAEA